MERYKPFNFEEGVISNIKDTVSNKIFNTVQDIKNHFSDKANTKAIGKMSKEDKTTYNKLLSQAEERI